MFPWMKGKISSGRQKLSKVFGRRSNSDISFIQEMLMPDSNLLPGEVVTINIINCEGQVWKVETSMECTIGSLISMAVSHFHNTSDGSKKNPSNYKLVSVSEKRPLDNEYTVKQEGVPANDELLLVTRRQPSTNQGIAEEAFKGPTEDQIKRVTVNIPERNAVKLPPPIECTADFQSEIRKILISLVEASARILTPCPNAEEIFTVIREKLENRGDIQPDQRSIKQLVDMGFSEEVASNALRMNGLNERQALDWLLSQNSVTPAKEINNTTAGTSQKTSKVGKLAPSSSNNKGKHSVLKSVVELLDSFKAYKRQEFKPNPKALQNLVDMGFIEEDVIDALRVTGNNQSSACEWLLGERRPSLEDLDNGLDPDGPIYKAIMANPAIQLSLTNPKMLLAFLSILENPSSANIWINDPDASPVLSQIFKTYHAEKHALQMNSSLEQTTRS